MKSKHRIVGYCAACGGRVWSDEPFSARHACAATQFFHYICSLQSIQSAVFLTVKTRTELLKYLNTEIEISRNWLVEAKRRLHDGYI